MNLLRLAAYAVLAAGLALATWVYLTAPADLPSTVAEEYLASKKYAHDVNLYGGKLTVLADDLSQWFADLWHGRQLALTIAVISGAVSLGIFVLERSDLLRKSGR